MRDVVLPYVADGRRDLRHRRHSRRKRRTAGDARQAARSAQRPGRFFWATPSIAARTRSTASSRSSRLTAAAKSSSRATTKKRCCCFWKTATSPHCPAWTAQTTLDSYARRGYALTPGDPNSLPLSHLRVFTPKPNRGRCRFTSPTTTSSPMPAGTWRCR